MSFNEPFFHKFHVDTNQPLFEVMRMPKVVSYLTATPRNNSSVSQKKLLEVSFILYFVGTRFRSLTFDLPIFLRPSKIYNNNREYHVSLYLRSAQSILYLLVISEVSHSQKTEIICDFNLLFV